MGKISNQAMPIADELCSYLSQMHVAYDLVREGTWKVGSDHELGDLWITLVAQAVLFRGRLMPVPRDGRKKEELFRCLLELNAVEMCHGAYGIEGDWVVVSETMSVENFAYEQFANIVEELHLALATHRRRLGKYFVTEPCLS